MNESLQFKKHANVVKQLHVKDEDRAYLTVRQNNYVAGHIFNVQFITICVVVKLKGAVIKGYLCSCKMCSC